MSPEAFQRELRRRLSTSSIEVRRDAAFAVRHGWHKDCILVFDRSPRTGEEYCLFVCRRHGLPAEPTELAVKIIYGQWAENIHRGRKAWADEIAQQVLHDADEPQRDADRAWDAGAPERVERAMSMVGLSKRWTVPKARRTKKALVSS